MSVFKVRHQTNGSWDECSIFIMKLQIHHLWGDHKLRIQGKFLSLGLLGESKKSSRKNDLLPLNADLKCIQILHCEAAELVGCVMQPQSPNELPGVRKRRQQWKTDSNASFPPLSPLIENISRNPICTFQNTTIWHIGILPTTAQKAIRCCLYLPHTVLGKCMFVY